MQDKLYFKGKHISTNMMLYETTVEAAKNPESLHEWVKAYSNFNSVGAPNLLFQVGYIGSTKEANMVKDALLAAGYEVEYKKVW